MKDKPTIIFDLDGTLLNTISDLGNACNYALRQMNLPEHLLLEYNKMVGNGLRKLIERAAPNSNSATIDNLVDLCREFYNDHCTDTTQPYPGIPELLNTLKIKRWRIAVASNKYQEGVDKIISHFFPNIPFISIQGQREGRPIKPDPSIIFDILQSYKIEDDVFMVGDSVVDIKTARNAGIKSVAVNWGFSSVEELKTENPDFIVKSPEDILTLFE